MKTLLTGLALCGGCFVLPAATTTATKLGTEEGPVVRGPAEAVALTASATASNVVVHANTRHACTRQVFSVYEVREHVGARLGGAVDPRAKVFGLFLAPVTIPVSALVTGVIVASGGDTRREHRPDHVDRFGCEQPANRHEVKLELASGVTAAGATNERGDLVVAIPPTEPYEGTITVRGGEIERRVTYRRPLPALAVARDAVLVCGEAHHVGGDVRLELEITETGRVGHLWVDAGDTEFVGCIGTRIAQARFPYAGSRLVLPVRVPGGAS
jgi:hypothetical protein